MMVSNTYSIWIRSQKYYILKTNFITVVFNKAPHGYPKAAVWSNTPVHTVQLPWRRVAVNLLLLVLRSTTTGWAIAKLLLLLLSGSGHKHTICLFSNVYKATSLFQLKLCFNILVNKRTPLCATRSAYMLIEVHNVI